MRRVRSHFLIATLTLAGCDLLSPPGGGLPEERDPVAFPTIDISETTLITMDHVESSEWLRPAEQVADHNVFDLSGVPLVRDGRYTDFVTQYSFPVCGGDVIVEAFNVTTAAWDTVVAVYSGRPPDAPCYFGLVPARDLSFRAQGLNPPDYVDQALRLRMRWFGLRVVRVEPCYSLGLGPAKSGLVWDGSALWTIDDRGPEFALVRLSPGGEVTLRVPLGTKDAGRTYSSLASDGERFWLTDVDAVIDCFDASGKRLGTFAPDSTTPGWPVSGMAYLAGRLWITRVALPSGMWLVGLDPDSSLAAGEWVVAAHTLAQIAVARTLGTDGTGLLLVTDECLVVVSTDGTVIRSVPHPVSGPEAIAGDGEAVWFLHASLRGIPPAYPEEISRFLLP